MKQLCFIAVILFFLISCDEKPKNPVAEYGDAMIGAYKRGQQAGEIATLDAMKQAIQMYYASNGAYPQSLDEIKGLMSKEIDISKYDYDPQTGAVRLKKSSL